MAKRVVIVLYFYQCNGGAHRYLHSVCEHWHRRGYEFEVWYYRAEEDAPIPTYAHKLPGIYPVRFFYINRSLQLAVSTVAEIVRRKLKGEPVPDVLVTLDAGEALLVGIVAAVWGVQVIHNDRGMDRYFRTVLNAFDYRFVQFAQKLSIPFVHKWVINSEAKAVELAAKGIPNDRMYHVPNGLRFYIPNDMPVFAGSDHDETGTLSFGYFSRPNNDRGIDIAFEIIRLLLQSENTDGILFFMTVGEEHIPEDLRDVEWIIPLGTLSHSDVAAWMARTDVVIVPTRSESFGNTVLEGLYYGACVVASAVGSLLHWKKMEGLVLVADYENPNAWLETLASVVSPLRTGHRRRFREELAEMYNFERQADMLYRTFTDAEGP